MRQCLLPAPQQGFEEHLQRSQQKQSQSSPTKGSSILTHVVLACQRKLNIIKELRTRVCEIERERERDRMKIKSE